MSGIEPFRVPEECRACPVQCELVRHLLELEEAKSMITDVGSHLIGEAGEAFDRMVEEQIPEELTEEVRTGFRQKVSSDLEGVDAEIEALKDESSGMSLACSGVLRMRASKADLIYTVGVCTSARLYTRGVVEKANHVPAHVKVTSRGGGATLEN